MFRVVLDKTFAAHILRCGCRFVVVAAAAAVAVAAAVVGLQ